MAISTRNGEEIVARGKHLYEEIRARVEAGNEGHYLVIDTFPVPMR